MVRIKFKTKQDRINGFYELATKGRGRGLPNDVFEVAGRYLKILDEAGIAYEIVQTEEEPINEAEALRNSLTVEV
jgi:hypothetical protein